MDFFSNLNSFLGSNPQLAQIAQTAVSNLTASPKSAPKVVQVAPAVQQIQTPSVGMSMGMKVGIGAAIAGALLLVVLILKRKG